MRDETQYYPTPPALADRMALLALEWVKDNKCEYPKIIDPSAGTGDLLVAVERANQVYYQQEGRSPIQYRKHKLDYYAVEIDADRHASLCHNKVAADEMGYDDKPVYEEKIPKLKVVGTDFMEFEDDRIYDVIIANPPFAEGMDHLLHAWDLLKVGRLIFLLNAANLQRDTAKSRLIRQLCLDHAPEGFKTPEILQGAFVGDDVERETNVDVALIVLDKSAKGTAFDFSDLDKGEVRDWSFDDGPENSLRIRDVIGDMVSCYEAAKANFMAALKAWKKAQKSLGEFSGIKIEEHFKHSPEASYESFMEALRDKGWALVFDKTKIREVATAKVKQDFDKARKDTADIAFTEANIRRIAYMLDASKADVMKQGILDVFDFLTKYHEENRCFPEGWKTNKAWKVTKKFIVPRLWYQWENQKSISWETREKLDDVDRAMGYLRGMKIDSTINGQGDKFVTIAKALNDAVADRNMEWVESTFFKLRWYKKGTVHCEFLDRTLYDDFNRAAMIGKKWLPDIRPKRN